MIALVPAPTRERCVSIRLRNADSGLIAGNYLLGCVVRLIDRRVFVRENLRHCHIRGGLRFAELQCRRCVVLRGVALNLRETKLTVDLVDLLLRLNLPGVIQGRELIVLLILLRIERRSTLRGLSRRCDLRLIDSRLRGARWRRGSRGGWR